ncbi:MAG: hypothetical protein PHV17_03870 [Candidatus Omnitrophica bacterium]|nr:hypothetical protein [Candidatus Omnitrophota bacterium]
MKVNRKIVKLAEMSKLDDSFVDASYAQRVLFIWELTKEIWSLNKQEDVERRLQRNVTKLIKQ